MDKEATILGATGLTGGLVLKKLIADNRYKKIKLFSRTSLNISDPKIEEHIIDLLMLKKYANLFHGNEVFCCIGTTAAKTPDKEKYRAIDYGIPVTAAKLCKANAIKTLIVVSALGASNTSKIFYNKVKGEMENAILKEQISKTHLLQPSLIAGKRNEKRIGEWFGKKFMFVFNLFFVGAFKKYRSIHPEKISKVMIWLANNKLHETRIPSDKIQKIANSI